MGEKAARLRKTFKKPAELLLKTTLKITRKSGSLQENIKYCKSSRSLKNVFTPSRNMKKSFMAVLYIKPTKSTLIGEKPRITKDQAHTTSTTRHKFPKGTLNTQCTTLTNTTSNRFSLPFTTLTTCCRAIFSHQQQAPPPSFLGYHCGGCCWHHHRISEMNDEGAHLIVTYSERKTFATFSF